MNVQHQDKRYLKDTMAAEVAVGLVKAARKPKKQLERGQRC